MRTQDSRLAMVASSPWLTHWYHPRHLKGHSTIQRWGRTGTSWPAAGCSRIASSQLHRSRAQSTTWPPSPDPTRAIPFSHTC